MPVSAAIHDNNGGTGNHCDGKLTLSVVIICIVAASAGLIFGYDVGISGGVTSMGPFLEKFFPSVLKKMAEATPNQYCIFDSQLLTLFTSSFYLSGLVASLLAGRMTIAGGRKGTLVLGGIIFLVGSALAGFATNVAMLILGRLLLGFGVGFTNQAAPVYLAEIAPPSYRGALVTAFQFFLSGGVVLASLVNVFVAPLGAISWRLAIGIAAVPAAVMTLGVLFIPDTPTSLLQRGKTNEARQSLIQIRGIDSDTEPEFNELIRSSQATQGKNKGPYAKIFERRYRPQLVLSMAISSCQQLTGISGVAFYAPVLFRSIGFGSNGALLGAAILGGVNLGSTVVSTILVDRVGRRFLFLEGGIQILICEVALAWLMGAEIGTSGTKPFSKGSAIWVLIIMCFISAAFGWSWGPLTFLVPSEMSPMEIRPAAQGISIAFNFLVTFILSQAFLSMLCHLKYGAFLLYAAFVILMTLFVAFFVPETKGLRLESMETIWQKHWFWRRFVVSKI